MSRIGEVCSLVPKSVVLMALTATATSKLHTQVSQTLGMNDELVVPVSPCKANVMYAVSAFTTIPETFSPMVEKLRVERLIFPKTIIYCRRCKDCANLYIFFRHKLGFKFTNPPSSPDLPRFH